MSKHTEGKWTVRPCYRPDLDDDPMGVYVVEPAQQRLTERYFECDDEEGPALDRVHEENQANARLMAAAPKMLKALKQFVRYAKNGKHEDWASYLETGAGAKMLSAIAEAEGGSDVETQID